MRQTGFACHRCGQFHVDNREPCYRHNPQTVAAGLAECRRQLAEALTQLPETVDESGDTPAYRAALERARAEIRARKETA